MKAVRWHAAGDLRLDEVELRLPLGPGMVEAEVRWAGICGSDVAEYRQPFAIRPGRAHPLTGQEPPLTLGHEFSALVTAVGEGVEGVAPGDRVAADACWRCGSCEACVSGRYNLCRLTGSIGLSSDGAFAPLVRFPAYCAVPLPDGVSDEAGALLEPLAVGLHALERGGARAGDAVVVLGYGPIGACTGMVARSLGMRVLIGALAYHNDLPRVAAMIAAGQLSPEAMITRRVPLAEAPAEIARLAENPGDDVKVLVEVGA